jgi:hypothetical protein
MDAPREVKAAIFLSWTVVFIETAERLWRISINPDATTFSRLRLVLTGVTLSSTALVALFICFAARRRNWGRIGLLVCTLGAWCLWLYWSQTVAEYLWWQWLVYGTFTAMELAALILLFYGQGALWYRSAKP